MVASLSLPVAILCLLGGIHGVAAGENIRGLREDPSFTMDKADYLPFDKDTAYQVILPGFKFNCYGYVTNWSALVVFENTTSRAAHEIHFQIWRPNGTGRYMLAGFHRIVHIYPQSNSVSTNDGLVFYNITNKVEIIFGGDKPLHFQPGDVLGVYISHSSPLQHPFYMTYHRAGGDTHNDLVMDMFYTKISPNRQKSQQPCQTNECSRNTIMLRSVIPNIYFNYETLTGPEDDFQQYNVSCEMPDAELEECPSPVPSSHAELSSTSTPSPSVQPKAEAMFFIAIAAAGFLLTLVAGGLVTVALLKKKKKAKEHSPIELLQRQGSRDPIYDEIKTGPNQMVDPATGHPYHTLEKATQTEGDEAQTVEGPGLYVPSVGRSSILGSRTLTSSPGAEMSS